MSLQALKHPRWFCETEIWVLLIALIKSRKDSCSLNLLFHSQTWKIKTSSFFTRSPACFLLLSFPVPPKITLSKAVCLGCFHDISSDSLQVSEVLKRAIQKFNKHSGEVNLFKLVEIKEAKRQVCMGLFSTCSKKKKRYFVCFMYSFLILRCFTFHNRSEWNAYRV